MKVYISGPVTGTTDYTERFARAAAFLQNHGFDVINPVAIMAPLPESTTWRECMAVSLALLTQADAIYSLRGWRGSEGAVVERKVAEALGLEILDLIDETKVET